MPGAYKRKSDKARGKAGKYTAWWTGEDGKQKSRAGFSDKTKTEELARRLDAEARMVREGLVEPGERARREAAHRPVADHVADYRKSLRAKGGTDKHCRDAETTLLTLLDLAGVRTLADLTAERLQQGLALFLRTPGRRQKRPRSARTANKALGMAKAWIGWLADDNRIKEPPRGLAKIERFNEAADRRRERRALTLAELDALLAAAEKGPPFEAVRGPRTRTGPRNPTYITGPERAALYRLAMGTGFRADELRTLTPERFDLDGDEPTVTVLACYSKNGKLAVQPVTRDLAAGLKPLVAGKPPGAPVIPVPAKTAHMLRRDLAAAGIDPVGPDGKVVDFHALRHSYITHLIRRGLNPKQVQSLARHSSVTLTLDRYTHVEQGDLRKALEGEE